MGEKPTDVRTATETIRRYLAEHPDAADAVEGVAVWWLSGDTSDGCLTMVQHAVDNLVGTGEVARTTLLDGTVIYERNKRNDPS